MLAYIGQNSSLIYLQKSLNVAHYTWQICVLEMVEIALREIRPLMT